MVLDELVKKPFTQVRATWEEDSRILASGNPVEIAQIADRHALELKIGYDEYHQLNEETLSFILEDKAKSNLKSVFVKNPDRYVYEYMLEIISKNIKNGKLTLPQFSYELDKTSRANLVGDGGNYIRTIFVEDGYAPLREFVKIFPSNKSKKLTRENEKALAKLDNIKDKIVTSHYSKGPISSYIFIGQDASRYIQNLEEKEGFVKDLVNTHLDIIEEANNHKFKNIEEFNDHKKSFFNKFVKRANPKIKEQEISDLLDSYQEEIGDDLDNQLRFIMNGDSKLSNAIVSGDLLGKPSIKIADWEFLVKAPLQKLVYDISKGYDNQDLVVDTVCDRFGYDKKEFTRVLKKEEIHEDLLSAARCLELTQNPKLSNKQKELEDLANIFYNKALRNLNNEKFKQNLIQYDQEFEPKLKILSDEEYENLNKNYQDIGFSTMMYPYNEDKIKNINKKLKRPRFIKRAILTTSALATLGLGILANNQIQDYKYDLNLQKANDRWNRNQTYFLKMSDPREEMKSQQYQDYLKKYVNEYTALAAIYAKDKVDAAIKRYGTKNWFVIEKDMPKLLRSQILYYQCNGYFDYFMRNPIEGEEALMSDYQNTFSNYTKKGEKFFAKY